MLQFNQRGRTCALEVQYLRAAEAGAGRCRGVGRRRQDAILVATRYRSETYSRKRSVSMPESPEPHSSTRGIATLAMLKTNFDRGRDHLSMFEPFIDDVAIHGIVDGATDADIQRETASRHQLTLPLTTVRTLVSRAVKKKILRREGGRYFKVTDGEDRPTDLLHLRAEVEERQARLADGFLAWSISQGSTMSSREPALQALMGFIERHHVRLALRVDREPFGVETGTAKSAEGPTDRLVARFIQHAVEEGSESSRAVAELLEGYVLQNTLLLADISTAERRFAGLKVFFDSNVLFGVLGLEGGGQALLISDVVQLLRQQGALPQAFSTTIREMRRVLAVYESRLGTSQGRRGLHPTELTRHFLTTRATPSDIHTISATLERTLASLGIVTVDAPNHIATYTLDETALGLKLSDRLGGENDPRVVHDIDCIAGVLTLRRGRSVESFDLAGAIFVSSSRRTIESVGAWFDEQDETGLPPIAHFLTISNLAWLKRPAGAASLKMAELVALCAASLRPSRKVWNAFQSHLERLEASGDATSDEVVAIMANSLTDRLLSENLTEDPDADSLSEVVDRVKASLAEGAQFLVDKATSRIEVLEAADVRRRKVATTRAEGIGATASWILVAIAAGSFALGTIVTVASLVTGEDLALWAILVGVAPLAVGALLGILWGFNLRDWQRRIAASLSSRVYGWLNSDT